MALPPFEVAERNFRAVAPQYMAMAMEDFGWTKLDAAACFGNAGYESYGFTALQEIEPLVPGSKGGYGWFMWTGPRRRAFLAYCRRHNFDPSAPLTNYKFLFVELTTTAEKRVVERIKRVASLEEKTKLFEMVFERSGHKNYVERLRWAKIALESIDDYIRQGEKPPVTVPVEVPEVALDASILHILIAAGVAVIAVAGTVIAMTSGLF